MAGEGFLPPVVGLLRLENAQFMAATRESGTAMKTMAAEGKVSSAGFGQAATKALQAISIASGIAAVASIKLATDFGSAMERVHTQAGASQGEVDRMKGKILELAPAVGTGPEKLAESLFHVESIGLRGAKALDTVAASAKLAKVGNADLEQTTNAVAAAMVTQMHDAKSLDAIIGLLNATIGQGNMKMDDLTAAISTGILPVAKNFGLGLADVGGALAVMTDRGMHADEAATRLKMTMTMMEAPTAKAGKALHSVGLSSTQLALDMHKPEGLVVALSDLKRHMDAAGLSAIQQAQVISSVFGGGRSSAGVQTLMNNLKTLDEKTKGVTAGVKTFGQAWDATMHTAKFRGDQLGATLGSAAVKLGDDLLPAVLRVVGGITKLADGFSHLPSGAQTAIIGVGLTLGPLAKMAKFTLDARNAWLALRASKVAQLAIDATVGDAELGLASKTAAEGVAASGATKALGARGLLGSLIPLAGWILAGQIAFDHVSGATERFTRNIKTADSAVKHYGIAAGLTAANQAKVEAAARGDAAAFHTASAAMVDGRHKALAFRAALQSLDFTVHPLVVFSAPRMPAGMGAPGPTHRMAAGGVLSEHVVGVGMRSGARYDLAEAGPEAVTPLGGRGGGMGGGGGGGGGGVVVNVYVHGVVGSPEDVARKLARPIRRVLLMDARSQGSGWLSPGMGANRARP